MTLPVPGVAPDEGLRVLRLRAGPGVRGQLMFGRPRPPVLWANRSTAARRRREVATRAGHSTGVIGRLPVIADPQSSNAPHVAGHAVSRDAATCGATQGPSPWSTTRPRRSSAGRSELPVRLGQEAADVFAAVDAAQQPGFGEGERLVRGHGVRCPSAPDEPHLVVVAGERHAGPGQPRLECGDRARDVVDRRAQGGREVAHRGAGRGRAARPRRPR
jgi:hypothetical protein